MSIRKTVGSICLPAVFTLILMNFPAYAGEVQPTTDEIEQMAVEWMDKAVSLAGGTGASSIYEGSGYDEFSKLFDASVKDSMIQYFYDGSYDYSWYTGKDQHFASVVASAYPYYQIDVVSAICAGQYPDYHTQTSSFGIENFVMTDEGLKYTVYPSDTDIQQKLNESFASILPDGYKDAWDAGRNVGHTYDNYGTWHVNPAHCVWGSLDINVAYEWIDEEGNLCIAFNLANGTGGNRSIYNFSYTLTSDKAGTIYDGSVDGSWTIMDGRNELEYFVIPASQVQHAADEWGGLNNHLSYSSQ